VAIYRSSLALLLFGIALPAFAEERSSLPNLLCHHARETARMLSRGTIDEVWEVFGSGALDFGAVVDPSNALYDDCRDDVVARLVKSVSRTDDTRIPARVISGIKLDDDDAHERILRAALRHPSPDVRRRAARAIGASGIATLAPLIEERFEGEADEGVRRDFMSALGAVESRRYLREIQDAARWGDPATRRVAIRALLMLPDEASVPILEDEALASPDDGSNHTVGIVLALMSWSEVPSARSAIYEIGRRGPARAAEEVIRQLSDPEHPDIEALSDIADARFAPEDRSLRDQALSSVFSLQHPDSGTVTVSFSCGSSAAGSRDLPLVSGSFDEFDGDVRIVSPADGGETARCWDAPGYMWPGEIRPRLPIGANGWIMDAFSWEGERWLALAGVGGECWLPETDLTRDDVPEVDDPALEIDLTAEETLSRSVGLLEREGFLTWIDSRGDLRTARVMADLAKEDVAAALVRIYRKTEPDRVRDALGEWLSENIADFEPDEDDVTEPSPP